MRVDVGRVGVDFLPLELNFGLLRAHFLLRKLVLGVWDSILRSGVDFRPLRVKYFGHLGLDFLTSGSRFLATESLFQTSGSSFIVAF